MMSSVLTSSAQRCDLRDGREINERVLEQFIFGIKHIELQKDPLLKVIFSVL